MNPMILNAKHILQHGSAAVILKTQAAGEEKFIPPKLKSTQCKMCMAIMPTHTAIIVSMRTKRKFKWNHKNGKH